MFSGRRFFCEKMSEKFFEISSTITESAKLLSLIPPTQQILSVIFSMERVMPIMIALLSWEKRSEENVRTFIMSQASGTGSAARSVMTIIFWSPKNLERSGISSNTSPWSKMALQLETFAIFAAERIIRVVVFSSMLLRLACTWSSPSFLEPESNALSSIDENSLSDCDIPNLSAILFSVKERLIVLSTFKYESTFSSDISKKSVRVFP